MGKRRERLQIIENARSRRLTFSKRHQGVMKKAFELSALCGCQVALITFDQLGRLYYFSSEDNINDTVQRFLNFTGKPKEAKHPRDYKKLCDFYEQRTQQQVEAVHQEPVLPVDQCHRQTAALYPTSSPMISTLPPPHPPSLMPALWPTSMSSSWAHSPAIELPQSQIHGGISPQYLWSPSPFVLSYGAPDVDNASAGDRHVYEEAESWRSNPSSIFSAIISAPSS